MQGKKGILDFAGFLSEEKAEKMKKAIEESRKNSAKADLEREKRLEKLWQ